MNIWKVAQPVVEDYIKKSIGPRAVLSDLNKTAMVLARFGPRLPRLVESALIRQAQETVVPERAVWWGRVICAGAGLVLGVTLMLAVQVIS